MVLNPTKSKKTKMNSNLLNSILKFLDPHVAICLLDYAKGKNIIEAKLHSKYMLNLLLRTKRFSKAKELVTALKSEIPAAVFDRLVGQLETKQPEMDATLAELKPSVDEMRT